MEIVLASASPRRSKLLRMIGIKKFKIIPDESEEESDLGLSPELTVCKIALDKAKNVSQLCSPDDLIIAADTLVFMEGYPIPKPTSPGEAVDMLRLLSGRKHSVYTGVVLLKGKLHTSGVECTEVFFRELSDLEIINYVNTGEPMDKAGAYGAQGKGSIFIERIEGDFFNVMGLPLCRLTLMLRNYGIMLP